MQLDFRRLVPENIALYRLYASYISHYLEAQPDRCRVPQPC
ncbi:MAG TPA: hypothetical protein PLS53_11535 [Thermoanaerobaculaceae bacterium]|nr:hypothetical protein [Thermoanaerobaculaceae bacterium]